MLNSISWTFYENISDKKLLSKATKWAKRSLELHEEYANADTYAALLYKTGKKNEARKAAELAIQLGKKENANYSATQDLLHKINLMK
jgi:thioredoxin 1